MADRSTPLRGFTCAVASVVADVDSRAAAGIAIGLDDNGDDVRVALSLRHADGTVLVAYLSEDAVDRLAHRLAMLVDGAPTVEGMPAGATLQ